MAVVMSSLSEPTRSDSPDGSCGWTGSSWDQSDPVLPSSPVGCRPGCPARWSLHDRTSARNFPSGRAAVQLTPAVAGPGCTAVCQVVPPSVLATTVVNGVTVTSPVKETAMVMGSDGTAV